MNSLADSIKQTCQAPTNSLLFDPHPPHIEVYEKSRVNKFPLENPKSRVGRRTVEGWGHSFNSKWTIHSNVKVSLNSNKKSISLNCLSSFDWNYKFPISRFPEDIDPISMPNFHLRFFVDIVHVLPNCRNFMYSGRDWSHIQDHEFIKQIMDLFGTHPFHF